MGDVSTIERHDADGTTIFHNVHLEDATGEHYIYPFRLEDDGSHTFVGGGEPSDRALSELEEFSEDEDE